MPHDINAEIQATANYANYNANAAVAYSDKWVGHTDVGGCYDMDPSGYNPEYYYYPNADCANFVSQCMLEGGMQTSDDWFVTKNTGSKVVKPDDNYTKSKIAWRYMPNFISYWKNRGYREIPVTSASLALPGNPIFHDNHVMLIVGVDSQGRIIYNGHNYDEYHCLLWPSSTFRTFDLAHDYSTYVCTPNTHTLACRVCNAQKGTAQAHSWISSGNNFVCAVCGYIKSGITLSETPEQQE